MVTIKNIDKKLSGGMQQVNGKIEVAEGDTVKADMDKMIGRINEISADIEGGDYYDG